jgi:hypothetical protein
MSATSTPLPQRVMRYARSHPARAQIGLFVLAYLVYSAARWVTIGDLGRARAHAQWILELEMDLGLDAEATVQQALTGTWVLWLLNHLYLIAQLVVVPGALVFLYRRSPAVYARLRNTVLATWLISIPVYAAFPVAPPRLADMGLADTITSQTGFAMDSKLTTSFYNELAAVPSLHVGFAVAVGVALAVALRRPAARALALLWGPAIGLAVVATGNHFVFDIGAGLVAVALGSVGGAAGAGATASAAHTGRGAPAGAIRPALAGG